MLKSLFKEFTVDQPPVSANAQQPVTSFLPDFCSAQSILMLILVGELLALIITLLQASTTTGLWFLLGIYSASIQVIALCSVAILCQLRGYLAGLGDLLAGFLSWSLIVVITFVYSLVIIRYYYALPLSLFHAPQLTILLKNGLIAGLLGAVALRYFYLQQRYKKQLQLEASARLQALQARIRPHFLFNSLNVIASLTRLDPVKAETAIEDLSDLIRATLDHKGELISLARELENGKRYMSLEQLRLGDRLKLEWQVDSACLSHLVPPLSVQPLLENAVYHGIQALTEGGTVSLKAEMDGDKLCLSVQNPLIPESDAAKYERNGRGMALRNIKQRLNMLFGSSGQLRLEQTATHFVVTMIVPSKLIHRATDK